MRRLVALLLVAALAVAVASCGRKGPLEPPPDRQEPGAATTRGAS